MTVQLAFIESRMRSPTKRVTDTQRLLWAIKPLTDVWSGMPLSFLTTFLMVALEEGQGVGDLARAYGISDRRVMSRFLLGLTKKPSDRDRGLDLLEFRTHPTNKQKKAIYLTDKGRDLLSKMLRPIGG
jgi:hypothetical protein